MITGSCLTQLSTLHATVQVKLWDISNNVPQMIVSQDLNTGAVFTLGFCAEAPHLLAAGGAKGEVVVWDVRLGAGMQQRFPALGSRPPVNAAAEEDEP